MRGLRWSGWLWRVLLVPCNFRSRVLWRIVWLCLTAILRLDAAPVAPTDYLIRTYTADEGLGNNAVFSLTQDRQGYIWCATGAGLARFDGVRFTTFDRDDTPVLKSRMIYSVTADLEGRLWVGNELGDLILRDELGFRPVTLPAAYASWNLDGKGRVILGTALGLYYRWPEGVAKSQSMVDLPPGVSRFRWPGFGPEWGSYLDPTTKNQQCGIIRDGKFVAASDPTGVKEFTRPRLYIRSSGEYSMLTQSGRIFERRALMPDGTLTAPRALPELPADEFMAISEDSYGNIWVGFRELGLAKISPSGDVRIFTKRDGLGADRIRYFEFDREGNLWVATDGGGVSVVTPRRFRTYGAEAGLGSEIVYGVLPAPASDGGGLWVATHSSGLLRMKGDALKPVGGFDSFPWGLHIDPQERLWVGDLVAGLFRREGAQVDSLVRGVRVTAICDDPKGGVWAGGDNLMHATNLTAMVETNWPGGRSISSMVCEPDGTLWIGTIGHGLWCRREGRFFAYGKERGLPFAEIQSLYLDRERVLWIGSEGGGLFRLKQDRISGVSIEQGLAQKSICGIAEDGLGYFWFTSRRGLFRVRRAELESQLDGRVASIVCDSFNRDDGIITIHGTANSQPKIAQTPDGRMWFATMRGLVSVNPAAIPVNTNPPPVVIEQMRVDGRILPASQGQKIPAGARRVEIHYAALSFTAPGKVRFRYRLEEQQGEWLESGRDRFAAFNGLEPGEHRFRVVACNNDGVWNNSGATLSFTVLPFFWETLWFRSSSAAATLGIAVWGATFVSQRKVRQRLAELERQRAVDLERARIARDIHDDVGSALTQLTLLGSPIDEDLGPDADPAAAHPRLGQIADLSREIVGKLDELVWTVNPRHDTTVGLVDYLTHHAESTLGSRGLRLHYRVEPGISVVPIIAERRHQLFLAYKEAIANVIKHSGATEVHLRIRVPDGVLEIEVEDNGRGFDPAGVAPTSDGLGNMRQRLEAIGGGCVIERPATGGTRVRFRLPLSNP